MAHQFIYRILLGVILLGMVLGLLPPAAARVVAPLAVPAAQGMIAADAPTAVAAAVDSASPPTPNVTPASRPARAPVGQLPGEPSTSARVLWPTYGAPANQSGVWVYTATTGQWALKNRVLLVLLQAVCDARSIIVLAVTPNCLTGLMPIMAYGSPLLLMEQPMSRAAN